MFNSLRYTKKLEEAGFSREQAEAQMQILSDLVETHFATKKDLEILEYRLTIKLGALITIGIGVCATIIKLIS